MWQQQFSTTTTIPKEKIWKVISDIENWHKWDDEIEYTKLNGEAKAGTNFVLKPKGAPKVTLTIEEFSPSSRFVDLTHFPLAKMRTIHELAETSSGTNINVTIQVYGLLGFLWRKIVAEKQVKGLPEQTRHLLEVAQNV